MIRSMTGFGRAVVEYAGGKIIAELKTVNHRFYELASRLPGPVAALEDKVRSHINTKVKRGRAFLSLSIEGASGLDKCLVFNNALAKKYYRLLFNLRKELGLKDSVSLQQVISLPEVVGYRSAQPEIDKIWPCVKSALDKALRELVAARQAEGDSLRKDLSARIEAIEFLTGKVSVQAPLAAVNYRKNLNKKIKNISPSVKLDSGRLEMEVAVFAKNCDISEEIVRVEAHVKNFKETISSAQEAGRRLDFIAQELFREVNTIGAKAQDVKISRSVIQIKEQIEKIREQVQNVE